MEINEKSLKRSRLLYICEATLEYLLSLLVTGSFLATLTEELGFSDSLTGILASTVSLGCLFQLTSITLNRRSIKRLAIVLSIINQVLFTLLYIVPLTPLSQGAKTVVFIVFMLSAYVIFNFIEPHKISWLISLVEDKKRGTFTANKEIVSLLSQMVFTFVMGTVMDSFTEKGDTRTAFIIAAAVMLLLMVSHTLTLVFTVEKERPEAKKRPLKESIAVVFRNKKVLLVTVVYIFYYVANYCSFPFYGTYMIKELGFSLQLVSVLTMCASIIRICVARAWGKYADKNSFAAMVEKCFIVLGLSMLCVVFATPKTGVPAFIMYNLLHGIAMGGINSAMTNLVFDYAPEETRAASLSVSRATAGLVGFLTTLATSPLITLIQENGNSIFGITVYAQQLVSLVACVIIFIGVVYVRLALIKKAK